jgi:hypothetical protein
MAITIEAPIYHLAGERTIYRVYSIVCIRGAECLDPPRQSRRRLFAVGHVHFLVHLLLYNRLDLEVDASSDDQERFRVCFQCEIV